MIVETLTMLTTLTSSRFSDKSDKSDNSDLIDKSDLRIKISASNLVIHGRQHHHSLFLFVRLWSWLVVKLGLWRLGLYVGCGSLMSLMVGWWSGGCLRGEFVHSWLSSPIVPPQKIQIQIQR